MTDKEHVSFGRLARIEAELKRIPGVIGVGYGFKIVNGKTSQTRSLRVYVDKKKVNTDVPMDEAIPLEIDGLPTDVLTAPKITTNHCEDTERHSPLIGGISISNFLPDALGAVSVGTLGFFATMNGVAGPKNVVLVSNNHVLTSRGATTTDTIYQPSHLETTGSVVPNESDKNPVAKIENVGMDGNYSYAYAGDPTLDFHLDCASAKLNISVSSWCDLNTGVSYKNEVRGLDIAGNSRLSDIGIAAVGDVVFKVGRTTSKTVGRVTDIAAIGSVGQVRLIEIEATADDCNGIRRFGTGGDSGSAVINDQNELIGLYFGSDQATGVGYAVHIHPVIDLLNVTPVSEANPPVGPAGKTLKNAPASFGAPVDHGAQLQKLLMTSHGKDLSDAYERHHNEVLQLVNQKRPVTVAWHRAQGPLFASHLLNRLHDPSHAIPTHCGDVSREDLVRRMADALEQHGSQSLKRDIERYLEPVVDQLVQMAARETESIRNGDHG